MTKGEILNNEFKIMPRQGESFVITLDTGTFIPKVWGFSNIGDLLYWLNEEADAWQKLKHPLDSSNG